MTAIESLWYVDEVQRVAYPEDIKFIVIDLFCGAGGTTTGITQARNAAGNPIALVAACVNHDPDAIDSHWANHPEVAHYEENIKTLPLSPLRALIMKYREAYPHAKIVLWASLECTNFSRAKGGQPRDADSRTLANSLFRYIYCLQPDYIKIENVTEFLLWGPMRAVCLREIPECLEAGVYANSELKYIYNKKTKREEIAFNPIVERYGEDFQKWQKRICKIGYDVEWREINSADLGAPTSRNRLFGSFAKKGLDIHWPTMTHSKKGNKGLKKWVAVKPYIKLDDSGTSIFHRDKPLVDNTLQRLISGVKKYHNDPACLIQNYGGHPQSKSRSLSSTCGTITCKDHHSLCFMHKYYGTGDNTHTLQQPAGTITTKDRMGLCWIDKQYSGAHNHSSLGMPAGSLLINDKNCLVTASLYNPSHGGHFMHINQPCPTIIARQDKAPLYLFTVSYGGNITNRWIKDGDSPAMIELKQLMFKLGIYDLSTRMLYVDELKVIQGFPEDYQLVNGSTAAKKGIGNSVVPLVCKKWFESFLN